LNCKFDYGINKFLKTNNELNLLLAYAGPSFNW